MRNFNFKNERGSALVLVLVLITALTIVCTLTLKGAYNHSKAMIHSEQSIQAFYLTEAAIQKTLWLLSGNMGLDASWRPVQESIEVFDNKMASVTVTDWGGLLRIIGEAKWGNRSETISVLAGIEPPSEYDRALVLGETGFPLVVTGHNQIIGDILVGMKGVETGMIEGQGFTGSNPVQGKIEKVINPELPFFDPSQYQRTFQMMKSRAVLSDLSETIYSDVTIDSVFMSDIEITALSVSGDVILIAGGSDPLFPDFFTLTSTGNITVRGNGNLGYGVQLISNGQLNLQDAPGITNGLFYSDQRMNIMHSGQLSGQFFSPDQVVVGGTTHLLYPSILFCSGHEKNGSYVGDIQVVDQAHVEGAVILFPFIEIPDSIDNETQIKIGQTAEVRGMVYSTHTTLLEGTVSGCVATEIFSLYIAPTTYINWLKGAAIDRTQLPNDYKFPVGFSNNTKFRIVTWEDFKSLKIIPASLNPYADETR